MKANRKPGAISRSNGNIRWGYELTCTAEELEQVKAAQGQYYTEDKDSGKPMFWTGFNKGKSCDAIINKAGKISLLEHEDIMEAEEALKNRGALGQLIAQTIVNRHYGVSNSSPSPTSRAAAIKADAFGLDLV